MREKKRKKSGGGDIGGALLQMMTISLFIILLAFFILLNAIAVVDDQRMYAAIGSLLGSFGGLSGGYSVIEGTGDQLDNLVVETGAGRIDFSDLFIAEEGLKEEIRILTDPRGTTVQIPAHILFMPDYADLIPSGKAFLMRLCGLAEDNDLPLEIAGHTDPVPLPPERETTLVALSSLQAMHVLRFFVTEGDIPAKRVSAWGWGPHRPAFSNATPASRALNRRVEVAFVHHPFNKKPQSGFTFKDFFFNAFDSERE